jgi:hypothetical protein
VVSKARERWLKTDSLAALCEAIVDEVLCAKAGVATHEELISDLLLLRGSTLPDPERRRMASIVTRAAVEAERHLPQPRFQEFHRRGKILVALRSQLIDFALALGKMADDLVSQDPLPSSARVLECLPSEPFPHLGLQGLAVPDASRLVHLATRASDTACANARLDSPDPERILFPSCVTARTSMTSYCGMNRNLDRGPGLFLHGRDCFL